MQIKRMIPRSFYDRLLFIDVNKFFINKITLIACLSNNFKRYIISLKTIKIETALY